MRDDIRPTGAEGAPAAIRCAARILSLLLIAFPAAAQIVVGKNVQISRARADNAHYESIAAADPLNPSGCWPHRTSTTR